MNVYFCDIYITARPRTPTAATRPGLKASRSASMGLKSSAPADSRGALWSIGCQPSAAESCSRRALHGCRPPPYALRPSPDCPEQSRHSPHAGECRDCSGAGVHDLLARGGGLVVCAAQTCAVIVDSKDTVGRHRRHQAGVRRRRPQGQRSPLWH